MKFKVGMLIRVIKIDEDPKDWQAKMLEGKMGIIDHIDDAGHLFCRYYGSSSSLALLPDKDTIEILDDRNS